jgi:hypothetical protein
MAASQVVDPARPAAGRAITLGTDSENGRYRGLRQRLR